MKFWDTVKTLPVNVNLYGPAHAYRMERIPNGMRIEAPGKIIDSNRAITTGSSFYMDITSAGKNDISVTFKHFLGYLEDEQRFNLEISPDEVCVEENEHAFVMKAGDMRVSVSRDEWNVRFEALEFDPFEGEKVYKLLTEIKGKGSMHRDYGLTYVEYDKQPDTDLPSSKYRGMNYEPYINCTFMTAPGELYYGLGERFTPFVKNGQSVVMWNEDHLTETEKTYVNVPFYISNNHYGLFVDHTTPVSYELNTQDVRTVSIAVNGEEMRFHVMYGEKPANILEVYTALTGRPPILPEWSFGYWFSTCSVTEWNEEKCNEMLDGLRSYNIPVDVLHLDGQWLRPNKWCDFVCDPDVFKDMKSALENFHKRGIRLCAWINPYVGQGSTMFFEGIEKGYFIKRVDGHGIKQTDNYWMPGQAIVDLTNPEAYVWWQNKVRSLIRIGIDTFKTDFGEKLPSDVVYWNGMNPMSMHNYYTYLYNKCVFEALEMERGIGEAVLFSRSGTAGSQKFPCNWSGDPSCSYESMAETLRAGLSYAMSGFAFWSHDIGGFIGWPTPDLYKRWVQFGMLSTHSRTHCSCDFKVPWAFDEESCEVLKEFCELKCSLMPYIYRMAIIAHEKGTPILRPMAFDFSDDIACSYLDMQYMFGDSLLVAPIFNCEGEVKFYLPQLIGSNKWMNILDHEVLEGNHQYQRKYDYHNMPLFVKGNTLLAVGGCRSTAQYDYADSTTVRWYLPSRETAPQEIEIPASDGKTACRINAEYVDEKYVIRYEGTFINGKVEILFEDGTTRQATFIDKLAIID